MKNDKAVEKEIDELCAGKVGIEAEIVTLLHGMVKSARKREIFGWGVGIAGVVAAAVMLPLGKTDIYVVKVDQATGYTQMVKVSGPEDVSADTVMDTYWAENYVSWRESYNFETAQEQYDRTMVMSSPDEQRKYDASWAGDNALDAKYGDSLKIEISDVTAVIDNSQEKPTAVVRYKATYKYSNRSATVKRYVAAFSYKYNPTAIMSPRDRKLNPLNYQVNGYTTSEEGGVQ